MAMTKAYLQYLNQHIEIAPANSQEEVEAASAIESVLRSQTGLSVEKHDIAGPAEINFVYGLLGAVFFIGMLLSGIGGLICALLGLLFAAFGFVFLLLRYLNVDVLSRTLPVGRSQNLVAHHKGYGPHSGHGTRPIVVMAHYDTGKEEFLYKPSIARYSSMLFTIAPIATAVAAACCLLQLFLFLPDVFLRVVWILGLIAALPALIWSINNIAAKFMPLAGAANDNNASVAALLGVVEDVCVSDPSKRAERRATLLEVAAKEAEEAHELGLDAFVDVSNTVLPEEKAAENDNPAVGADKAAAQIVSENTAPLAEEALEAVEVSASPEKSKENLAGIPTGEADEGIASGGVEKDGQILSVSVLSEVAPAEAALKEAASPAATLKEGASHAASLKKDASPEPALSESGTNKTTATDTDSSQGDATAKEEISTTTGVEEVTSSPAEKPASVPEFTAVRHGADVIKEMKILPDYCDLEYVDELVVETDSEVSAPNPEGIENIESAELEDLSSDDGYNGDNEQEDYHRSARRPRRRAAAQPQTPLEKVQSFFASLPSPADLLAKVKGSQPTSEKRSERVRRGHDRPATSPVHEGEIKATHEPVPPKETDQESLQPVTQETKEINAEISQALKKVELNEAKEESASLPAPQNTTAQPAVNEQVQTDEGSPAQQAQQEVSDPMWGTSSFEPINDNKNVARRAALFDLPDPSVATVDPLSEDFQIQHTGEIDPRDFPVEEFGAATVVSAEETSAQSAGGFEVLHEDLTQPTSARGQNGKDKHPSSAEQELNEPSNRFGKQGQVKSHKREEQAGPWKGGATFSEAAREENDADNPEKQTELEEAVLDMDYVDLVSHDIWFVLTGGAGLDHAGAKTFFREHKKDLRGACVINLEAVGAGELTALTEEGFGFNKKADHRMLRFFKSISRDLHIPLLREKRVWADTEATFAMREKLRSVTLMGTDPGQIPALAHTDQNVPENVDANQVAQANMIVSELIRRL